MSVEWVGVGNNFISHSEALRLPVALALHTHRRAPRFFPLRNKIEKKKNGCETSDKFVCLRKRHILKHEKINS